jgi:hypothetical protein
MAEMGVVCFFSRIGLAMVELKRAMRMLLENFILADFLDSVGNVYWKCGLVLSDCKGLVFMGWAGEET